MCRNETTSNNLISHSHLELKGIDGEKEREYRKKNLFQVRASVKPMLFLPPLKFLYFLLVHGSYFEQRIFATTKWLGKYQVQASRLIAQVIVLVIINAMIGNDRKIGNLES